LSALAANGKVDMFFPIFYCQEQIGQLNLMSVYTPSQMQVTTFDPEEKERELRDTEMMNNQLDNNIRELKQACDTLEEEIKQMKNEDETNRKQI
jgi:septal ring factor EnvC (AmiA/AmiB activator)